VASAPAITSEDERPPPTPVYSTRVLTVWGLSGSGKSQIVTGWLSDLEAADGGSRCFVGYSKLDEHMQKPLASFVQIFESLLDRVLTDPKEDPKEWNKKIRYALGHQFSVFHSLLSSDVRKLVTLGTQAPPIEAIDWANFVPAFKMWSKRLLQLFATRGRPLVLLVDDIHWMAEEEVRIWRALLDGPQPLNHVLVLSLYRVEVPEPPPPQALLSATAASLVIRRLPEAGVAALTKACFKTSVDNVMTLASLLYAETGGSPLYLRSMLATLVSWRQLWVVLTRFR
jgi:predicted ATPase